MIISTILGRGNDDGRHHPGSKCIGVKQADRPATGPSAATGALWSCTSASSRAATVPACT